MLSEGYAAVTARRIAAEAGVTAPLVHYHFGPLDDLFIAVLRRRAEEGLERQRQVMAGDRPLSALWDFSFATATVRYITEFMALAHHRDAVKEELVRFIQRFQEAAVVSLEEAQQEGRVALGELGAFGVVTALINSARGIAMQWVLGTREGHDEAVAIVMNLIGPLERGIREPEAGTRGKRGRRLLVP